PAARAPTCLPTRRSSDLAVVLDPDSGDLLASASYPWPLVSSAGAGTRPGNAADSLLDRARYGLYPPGSTFKLVTAAAALRQDGEARQSTRLNSSHQGASD